MERFKMLQHYVEIKDFVDMQYSGRFEVFSQCIQHFAGRFASHSPDPFLSICTVNLFIPHTVVSFFRHCLNLFSCQFVRFFRCSKNWLTTSNKGKGLTRNSLIFQMVSRTTSKHPFFVRNQQKTLNVHRFIDTLIFFVLWTVEFVEPVYRICLDFIHFTTVRRNMKNNKEFLH